MNIRQKHLLRVLRENEHAIDADSLWTQAVLHHELPPVTLSMSTTRSFLKKAVDAGLAVKIKYGRSTLYKAA